MIMRLVKFRGKNLKGEWEYGYYLEFELCDGEGRRSYIKKDGCQPIKVLKETVGQFTGLLDKNGIEIYEGDIIKISKHEIPGIIKWDNLRLCFLCEWTNMPTAGDIGYLVNCCLLEVVGTVFDNPELLKEDDNFDKAIDKILRYDYKGGKQ